MSFQITVLKVLAGHPEGRASIAELTRYVSILISSGTDWTDRTKRMAARAPKLDIFADSFVLRDNNGWHITEGGRQFLASLEAALPIAAEPVQAPDADMTKQPRSLARYFDLLLATISSRLMAGRQALRDDRPNPKNRAHNAVSLLVPPFARRRGPHRSDARPRAFGTCLQFPRFSIWCGLRCRRERRSPARSPASLSPKCPAGGRCVAP
jgi:hypothetical protein